MDFQYLSVQKKMFTIKPKINTNKFFMVDFFSSMSNINPLLDFLSINSSIRSKYYLMMSLTPVHIISDAN